MADIIYTYKNEVYANITNKCDCACTFCIRSQKDAIGDATSLWHTVDPTYDEIIAAIDAFDFTGYEEFVLCGYGEPTCALDILEKTAKYLSSSSIIWMLSRRLIISLIWDRKAVMVAEP